ncbi:Protein SAWADEE HOMEODOMAIN-LIKE 2 [Orobanche hederae]
MGRPPTNGVPSFRFNPVEVGEMDAILQAHNNQVPAREILDALANRFSTSTERAGKVEVSVKQVWNWFQNRRYALRAKAARASEQVILPPVHDQTILRTLPQAPTQPQTQPRAPQPQPIPSTTVRSLPQVPHPVSTSSTQSAGRNVLENSQMEFEAKSARDGAWYDVASFLSHRSLATGDPDARVRFAGFGPEEDEWVNIRRHVRQRSLPCESSECVAVLPGDLVLCFQEGKEQALYFDAHVLDAQRRRHDVRGCRCRFLVRYDHDQSEEIVPLRKICRRPETDHRLQQLHAVSVNVNSQKAGIESQVGNITLKVDASGGITTQKQPKSDELFKIGSFTNNATQATAANVTVGSESNLLRPEITDAGNSTAVGNTNFSQAVIVHPTATGGSN